MVRKDPDGFCTTEVDGVCVRPDDLRQDLEEGVELAHHQGNGHHWSPWRTNDTLKQAFPLLIRTGGEAPILADASGEV